MSATEAATVVGVEAVDTGTGEIHRPTVLMTEDEARIITADIKAWAGTLWQKLKQPTSPIVPATIVAIQKSWIR